MSGRRPSAFAYAFFFCLFAFVILLSHATVLRLPYFWDELGQFIPAALDIYKGGAWIPKSTLPNVHPPGVMAYLAGIWHITGYSVESTRAAMLLLASFGVLSVFLLAVELCGTVPGLPAFTAAALLISSPLFYTQAFMAQLDMPAMVFTALALLLFLRSRFAICAVVCTLLVGMKETSIIVPAVFGAWLLWERRWRPAFYFLLPAIGLLAWLLYLKSGTGHIFGNREFTHYNVTFQLHPVRLGLTLLRRIFYLFADNFHWLGTIPILLAFNRTTLFRTRAWKLVAVVFIAQTLMVTVLGGAALERYLMPVLPLFYIASAAALATLTPTWRHRIKAVFIVGLVASLFLPSIFPYPYENSWAVVDFVELQKSAAQFVEQDFSGKTVASAWPFPDALRRPEFGYVSKPIAVKGIDNFNKSTVAALKEKPVDVFVIYSRTWEPERGVIRLNWIRSFLEKYYLYEPQISPKEIQEELGMVPVGRWQRRGQWIEVYARSHTPNLLIL